MSNTPVNREARIVTSEAELDHVIRVLSNAMNPPKHIIDQLKTEQKRLFKNTP